VVAVTTPVGGARAPARGTSPTRILLAVRDSTSSLRAARLAIGVALAAGCPLLAVTAVRDGALELALARATRDPDLARRHREAGAPILRHVLTLARAAGVEAEGRELRAEPGPGILQTAREWGADLVVVGRGEAPAPRHGYLGDVALHVLELADVPVLLVP
jgi:nucleotide-binding universal stress UspA family protein